MSVRPAAGPPRGARARRPSALVLLLAAAAFVAPPTAARAQGEVRPAADARAAAEARLAAALDAPTRDSIAALVAEARRRGLPDGPLVAKALEGVEKGAPAAQIPGAVRKMLDRLTTAAEALAPWASDAELVAGADAIAAKVPPSVLRDLRALSPKRSTATALGVLAQLVSRGVSVKKAQATVMTLLQRGGGPQQLLALERSVNGGIATGLSPAEAFELNSKALLTAFPIAAPSATNSNNGAIAEGATMMNAPGRSRP